MGKVVKRTFSLTEEQAAFIDAKVATGAFASGSEVLRAGLRQMEERDRMLDRVMHELVLPVIDRYGADPSRLVEERAAERAMKEHQKRSRQGAADEKAKTRLRA